jgi:uncharacterized protein (TIGR03067 family)
MKRFALLAAIAGLLSAADAPQRKENKILGSWTVISVRPTSSKTTRLSRVEEMAFTKGSLVRGVLVPDRVTVVLTDGRVLVLDYRQGLSKKPQEIDLLLAATQENAEIFRGVFLVEGDTCKLCLSPSGADRPAGLTPKKGSGQVLLVLRRDD